MGAEARRYSWPPFPPGHELSVRHGVWSRRRVDPLVQELVAGLRIALLDLRQDAGNIGHGVLSVTGRRAIVTLRPTIYGLELSFSTSSIAAMSR